VSCSFFLSLTQRIFSYKFCITVSAPAFEGRQTLGLLAQALDLCHIECGGIDAEFTKLFPVRKWKKKWVGKGWESRTTEEVERVELRGKMWRERGVRQINVTKCRPLERRGVE
jgi:hypothetical protein